MIRQRLLGFLMLLALVVVFWPIVFEPPSSEPVFVLPEYSMPSKPEVDISKAVEARGSMAQSDERLPIREELNDSDVKVVVDPEGLDFVGLPPVASDGPDRDPASLTMAEFDEQGLPIAWELELVQFSSDSEANQLVGLLQESDYKAYSTVITRENRLFYSIRIGPKLQRERLLDIKSRLDEFFGIDSSIRRFEP
ncbi:MAG: SPOR domain-containing protein [Luminiphilus sp.]|nr:SPOR domain-containing protein [Luminiphilus sp.]